MRWKLLIAACSVLVAPMLEGAAAAARPEEARAPRAVDRKAGRKPTPAKPERHAEGARDRVNQAGSNAGSKREREEHDHDRDDD